MTIPYNPASPKADEFINHQEILDTLAFADERSRDLDYCRSLLEKARTLKGLTHREASVLLACEDPSILEGIYDLAREIKDKIYGQRIVLFAPLYLSNYCVNGCVYCPLPHEEQTHCPEKAHPGRNPQGSHRPPGYGPQTAGPGSRRRSGEQPH